MLAFTDAGRFDRLTFDETKSAGRMRVGLKGRDQHCLVFDFGTPETALFGGPRSRADVEFLLQRMLDGSLEPTRPLALTADRETRLRSTVVSDGVNLLIAVSNLATKGEFEKDPKRWRRRGQPASVTMTLDPRLLDRFRNGGRYRRILAGYRVHTIRGPAVSGPAVGPWTFPLRPGETLVACVEAELPGDFTRAWQNDAKRKLDAVDGKLDALERVAGERYDVGPARELVGHVRHFVGTTHYGRGLAGLVMLRNTMILSAQRTGDRLAVRVRAVYVDIDDPAGPERPVRGGRVKLVRVLNAHEEQGAAATTDDRGEAVLGIGETTGERWDFVRECYRRPPQDRANDPVEVHVHDPVTGAHAFALVE